MWYHFNTSHPIDSLIRDDSLTPDDLRNRLKKLGVQKGARNITPRPKPQHTTAIETLIDGEIIETDYGPCFVHLERYAPDYVHGIYAVGGGPPG